MSAPFLKNGLGISHMLVEKAVCDGDIVVDATAGNGNDTVFLAKLVGENGKVYSFDIQEDAINNTKTKLIQNNLEHRVILMHDGHQNIDQFVPQGIKAAMFNLGYLPGGDHSIQTQFETTSIAVSKCLDLLLPHGIVSIVIYYGGDSGFLEKEAVLSWLKTLDYRQYTVLVHDFINAVNCPPIAVIIEKNFY